MSSNRCLFPEALKKLQALRSFVSFSDLVGRRDLVLRATKIVLIDSPVIQRGIGDCNQGWQEIAASSLARA